MFLCDDCLKDSCEGLHLSNSFGPCEGCGGTRETWDCIHYKAKRTGAKTLDQVHLEMLEHLRSLARELHDGSGRKAVASLIAEVACAREMCRIAGISVTVIEDTVNSNTLG